MRDGSIPPAGLLSLVAPMIAFLSLISPTALAQNGSNASSGSTLSAGFKFAEKGGEELYVNICQGCHMPDGKGATGAGAYPSIAGNGDFSKQADLCSMSLSTGSERCRRLAT